MEKIGHACRSQHPQRWGASMKKHTRKLLDKAIDTIEGAEILLTHQKTNLAAGRAYYALFYIAEALLNEKGLQFKEHGKVIGAYGKEYAKTNLLDQKFHRWLRLGFDTRLVSDYQVDANIETVIATDMINQAREFLEAAQRYLK